MFTWQQSRHSVIRYGITVLPVGLSLHAKTEINSILLNDDYFEQFVIPATGD
jgi:hypothetical protein